MKILPLLFLIPALLGAQENPAAVLDKIDAAQRNYKNFGFKMEMKIENRGRTLIKNTAGVSRTDDDSAFIEYTNPQDRGTRYLKLGQDMWIYTPDAQDVLKISGHLLRDGMMGSDISYDDMMERGTYKAKYVPTQVTTTNLKGTDMLVLTLMAKNNSVSYARQDLFVQRGDYLVRKVIMYAKGRNTERAIKEFEMDNYKKFSGISVAMLMTARDLRKGDSRTIVTYGDIQIDPPLEAKIFTRAYLER